MIEIRDSHSQDFPKLKGLFGEIHKKSVYRFVPFDWHHMRRMFSMASAMPNFFCQVVIKDGEFIGIFAGSMELNVWGANVASDLLVYSLAKTDVLIKNFVKWGTSKGADIISITNISGRERYDHIIESCGFEKIGNIYRIEVD